MATKTALGDAGDEEPDLTPQQREAIRKAFSSPFQLQQFKLAESTFSSLNKTINAAMITSIAPALKLFADQQAAMVASMGGAASIQMRLAEAMTPILDQVKQVQAEIAKSLQVRILASEEFQSRFTSMVVSREFTEAMRRVRELSEIGRASCRERV